MSLVFCNFIFTFVVCVLQDKTLSAATLPDADTSSAKSSLDEDENTSSISDGKTSETKDSTNDTEEADLEARLKPQETAANDAITVEVSLKLFFSFSESVFMGWDCL